MRRTFFLALLLMSGPALADVSGTRIVVPAHDIRRGDTIAESDLAFATLNTAPQVGGIVTSMRELNGMEARRLLRAGEALRNEDVRRPILVTKGETVTMTFDAPGVTLTAIGKATGEGGMGETVTVLNPISYRQITAIVTGAGQVRAGDVTPVSVSQ